MPNIKVIILAVVLIILFIIFVPGYSKIQKLKGINKALTDEIKELETKNTQLKQEITKLSEDIHYVEKTARNKLGLGKKGEVIYRITEE